MLRPFYIVLPTIVGKSPHFHGFYTTLNAVLVMFVMNRLQRYNVQSEVAASRGWQLINKNVVRRRSEHDQDRIH
jgi:hypothetical protein